MLLFRFLSFFLTYICPLTVLPEIEIHPEGGKAKPGNTTILNCYSSRAESYKWAKDGYLMNIMGNDRISLLPNGSLKIKEFTTADNGEYWCYAINPTGEVASTAAYIGIVGKHSRVISIYKLSQRDSDKIN